MTGTRQIKKVDHDGYATYETKPITYKEMHKACHEKKIISYFLCTLDSKLPELMTKTMEETIDEAVLN